MYLSETAAVFVFRGPNVRALVGETARRPAVWKAGLAWQPCFAGPPQVIDLANLEPDAELAYCWTAISEQVTECGGAPERREVLSGRGSAAGSGPS